MLFFIFRILLIFGLVYGIYSFVTARHNEKIAARKIEEKEDENQEDHWSEF